MTQNTDSRDEAEILRVIADQQSAVRAKDVDRIMSHYAAEFAVFNVKPPFQIRGTEEWRRVWEASLSHFPASFGTETRDLAITMSGGLAVAHYLARFAGLPGEPRVDSHYRCVQTDGGRVADRARAFLGAVRSGDGEGGV